MTCTQSVKIIKCEKKTVVLAVIFNTHSCPGEVASSRREPCRGTPEQGQAPTCSIKKPLTFKKYKPGESHTHWNMEDGSDASAWIQMFLGLRVVSSGTMTLSRPEPHWNPLEGWWWLYSSVPEHEDPGHPKLGLWCIHQSLGSTSAQSWRGTCKSDSGSAQWW